MITSGPSLKRDGSRGDRLVESMATFHVSAHCPLDRAQDRIGLTPWRLETLRMVNGARDTARHRRAAPLLHLAQTGTQTPCNHACETVLRPNCWLS